MKKFEIWEKELKNIGSIIKTTRSVEKIYQQLYVLEKLGKKDSEEYKKYLNYLDVVLECEDQNYQKYIKNIDICIAYLYFFEFDRIPMFGENHLHNILINKYECGVTRRIRNRLKEIKFNMLQRVPKEYMSSKKERWIDEKKICYENEKILSLASIIKEEVLHIYLMLLSENENADTIKNKYITSFIYPRMERLLVKNQFDVDDKIDKITKKEAVNMGISRQGYYMAITYKKMLLLMEALEILKSEELNSEFAKTFIRAIFLSHTNESTEFFEYEILHTEEDVPDNKRLQREINDTMEMINKDKENYILTKNVFNKNLEKKSF